MTKTRFSSAGFTLLELTVSLGLGAIVVLTVYTITSGSARIFHEQQRIAASQLALRSAVERLHGEISRAGYLTTPNSDRDRSVCQGGGANCPNPPLHGLVLLDGGGMVHLPASNDGVDPDTLTVFGAFGDTDRYLTTRVGGGTLELDGTTQSYVQRFDAAQAAGNLADVIEDSFNVNRILRIQCPGGQVVFQSITGAAPVGNTVQVNYGALANGIPLFTPVGAGIACEVSTGSFVQYTIANLCLQYPATCRTGGEPEKTDLVRTDLSPTLVPLPQTERIIAEYAVDFDVRFEVDQALPPAGAVPNPPVTGYCGFGQSAAWADGPGNANSLVGRIRAVLFRLSVRTRAEDANFPFAPRVGAGPLLGYKLNQITAGACRVRTMTARVPLPNFAAANIQAPAVGALCPQ